jgi:Iap family predicted aminopeptidase
MATFLKEEEALLERLESHGRNKTIRDLAKQLREIEPDYVRPTVLTADVNNLRADLPQYAPLVHELTRCWSTNVYNLLTRLLLALVHKPRPRTQVKGTARIASVTLLGDGRKLTVLKPVRKCRVGF